MDGEIHKVPDPYRFLEKTQSKQTLKWVKAERKLFTDFVYSRMDIVEKYEAEVKKYKERNLGDELGLPDLDRRGFYLMQIDDEFRRFKVKGDTTID